MLLRLGMSLLSAKVGGKIEISLLKLVQALISDLFTNLHGQGTQILTSAESTFPSLSTSI